MPLVGQVYGTERATLIQGDCLEVLPELEANSIDIVITDPPYGIGEKCNRLSRKRTSLARCNDFPNVVGDDKPFDPSHLLRFSSLVLFGANYYAHLLPPSSSWLVWDKLDGLTSRRPIGFNDQADVEMIWTNLGGPARLIPHRWMGCIKASERRERRVHPTQKPVVLMQNIIEHYTSVGDLVLDPYAGSCATGVAAIHAKRRFIGIEIVSAYCTVAKERIAKAELSCVKQKET